MSKLWRLLALMVALALAAAACATADDDAADTTEPEDTTEETSADTDTDSDEEGDDEEVDLTQAAGSLLDAVIEADVVRCGTRDALPGFAVLQPDGTHEGFDNRLLPGHRRRRAGRCREGRVRRSRDRRPLHRPAIGRDRRPGPQHHLDGPAGTVGRGRRSSPRTSTTARA